MLAWQTVDFPPSDDHRRRGRLVIPKRIRDRLGLRGNDQVELLVARAKRPLPPLTDEVVREAR